MTYYDFTKYIKMKRLKKGLTQREIAEYLSISTSKYNKIENGSTEPSFKELLLLLKLYNINLLELDSTLKKLNINYD